MPSQWKSSKECHLITSVKQLDEDMKATKVYIKLLWWSHQLCVGVYSLAIGSPL